MKKYILNLILVVLMMASFFISGLFFVDSELVDFEKGINNEKSIAILSELDGLPLIEVNPYEISFFMRGEIVEVSLGSVVIWSDGVGESFVLNFDISDFEKGEVVVVGYRYLPEGGREVFWVEKK